MYWLFFLLTFILSVGLTMVFGFLMQKFNIVDKPRLEKRKIHKKKIPYGGGLAIFASFFIIVFLVYFFSDLFSGINITGQKILALFLGSLFLMVGGFFDDKYNLSAKHQIWFPILASLIVLGFGFAPQHITNPCGGVFDLTVLGIGILTLANVLTFVWLMGMMYTTKFLDGLDGLVSGVVLIGVLSVFFLSLQEKWYQPDVALLTIIFAGALFGFLLFNFHPAKIFLGEGGSLFAGFMLASLAIISGSKIATTLIVMAVPVFDVGRVIVRRWQKGQPVYAGDSEHLHFRLLKTGLSQKQVVFFMYSVSFLFGVITYFLQSSQKLVALLFLFVLMLLSGVWLSKREK